MVDMYEEGKVEVNKANIKEFVIKNNIKQIENMTKLEYNMNEHRSVFFEGGYNMEVYKKNIRLKQLRKESKITQEQLAKYLDVDQTMITKLENGTRSMNVTIIEKICNLFGCSDAYLMGEDDTFIPLNFAFRSNGIQTEDLESVAAVNKIVMNIRYMNEMIGD